MHKDQTLIELSEKGNIAQFISYSPEGVQRYSLVAGFDKNHLFEDRLSAIQALIFSSQDKSVNVRSFNPAQPKGHPFDYGLTDAEAVVAILDKHKAAGLYSIVNETVNINDGGVSGVVVGNIIEFSPNDTPRCVEKDGICLLPRKIGIDMLKKVYGFYPDLFQYSPNQRVEFSIHPLRRGYAHGHTIIWEVEEVEEALFDSKVKFPNNFSRHIGDKVFGLLLADTLGFRVPKTVVVGRNVAPFVFGDNTETGEQWIRTCPSTRESGKYPTFFGWRDPFKLMQDLDGVVSVVSQDGVGAKFSGSLLGGGEPIIEGVAGYGDDFMLGDKAPSELPYFVVEDVHSLYKRVEDKLGAVDFEWVHDGSMGGVWLVQLHQSENMNFGGRVIYNGSPAKYIKFEITKGSIENLRALIERLAPDEGIELVGKVGITSHFGDVLRKKRIPSFIS